MQAPDRQSRQHDGAPFAQHDLRPQTLDLSRGYVTPFLDWAGRLTLGQASKQEEARLSQGYPRGPGPLEKPGRGRGLDSMDCFEAPRMGLNLIFIKVSAAPTGALGPWKVEEP